MSLRVIADDSDPLPIAELKSLGDQLLTQAKKAAGDALLASVQPEFLFQLHGSYGLTDVTHLRAKAKVAADAWAKVDQLLSELVNEVEKSKRGLT